MKRIRIEDVNQIDFTNPAVIKSLAKAYSILLKDIKSSTPEQSTKS